MILTNKIRKEELKTSEKKEIDLFEIVDQMELVFLLKIMQDCTSLKLKIKEMVRQLNLDVKSIELTPNS